MYIKDTVQSRDLCRTLRFPLKIKMSLRNTVQLSQLHNLLFTSEFKTLTQASSPCLALGALVLVVNIPSQRTPTAMSARCSSWRRKMVVR